MGSMRIKVLLLIFMTRGLATAQVQDCFVKTEEKVNFPISSIKQWGLGQKHSLTQAVVFQNRIFDSVLYCKGFRLVKPVSFSGTIFQDICYFSDNTFEQEVSFSRAKLSQGVYFISTVFWQAVDFANTVFLDKIHFEKVHFKEKVNLRNVQLPSEIYILDIDLSTSFLDFTQAKVPAKPCNLYLQDTQHLDKIKFDYQYFQLGFEENRYLDFRKIEQLYIELLKYQKTWGFIKGFQKLWKEYEAFKNNGLKTKTDSIKCGLIAPSVQKEETIVETTKVSPPTKNTSTKAFVLMIAVVLVLAFVYLRLQEKKRKAEIFDPVVELTSVPTFEPSKAKIPLAKIAKNIDLSTKLWEDYLLITDQEMKDDAAFWNQYERLLKKVRN